MADNFASGGHVMSTNMADDLILADNVAFNLIVTSNV
jgi:hypothetical protein